MCSIGVECVLLALVQFLKLMFLIQMLSLKLCFANKHRIKTCYKHLINFSSNSFTVFKYILIETEHNVKCLKKWTEIFAQSGRVRSWVTVLTHWARGAGVIVYAAKFKTIELQDYSSIVACIKQKKYFWFLV